MSGKSSTISTQEPVLGGIQVQTSTYGLTIGLLWGRPRVPGNLLWYGDFKAIPHTEVTESGGKGGGGVRQERTSYTYEAAVAMGIGAGPVNGIVSAWKGKDRFSGASVASQTRTVQEVFTVPFHGVYTVAGSGIFARNVAVRFPGNDTSGDEYGWAGVLVDGVDYTSAAGTYTFPSDWRGTALEVEYQVADSASTTSALGQLGLNLATGTLGQPTWSHLTTNHSAQAIGYSGLAYVYATNYQLTSSAQVENHNFEVSTPSEFSSSIPDANMAVVVKEFLTDGLRGCLWPAAKLGDLTHFSNYCVSHGLFMSPALLEQAAAADVLKGWLKLTNSDVVWSALQLKVVPLGDESKTANGATYTANTTPVYDLVSTDFVTDGDQPRIKITPRVNEDAYNHIRVEYQNRANGYNLDIISAKDLAHIEQYGERVMEVIKAHDVKTAEVASFVAQMELQRQMAVWNTYSFTLPWTKGRLEPLDLVTLTDDQQTLDRLPVRIKKMVEAGDDAYDVEAEDAPIGHASAPLFGTQAGNGYAPDYNSPPGDALAPVIFEAPGAFSTTGVELLVATAGSNSLWGGCQVWASYDGTNYQQIGELRGGSRYGALTAAVGSTAPVSIHGGQLLSGTAADLAALATLCYIGGATPEYFAYETATLTSADHYTLSTLSRGAYGTSSSAHSIGDPFVRVDGALARSGALDSALVGTTVYIKLTSFNVFGGGQQSLADVSATTYVITGAFIAPPAGAALTLQATAIVMKFNAADAPSPSSQTITLTAVTSLPGTATFLATRFNAAGSSLGTVTLGGSGNIRTLTEAQFGAAAYCVVTVTLGSFSDQVTIARVKDGAQGLPGNPGDPGDPGSNGTRTAIATAYRWDLSIPTTPSGAATYTWAGGGISAAPTLWSLTPGATPVPGYTLWALNVTITNTNTTPTDSFNWSSGGIRAAGSSGNAGDSARKAYTVILSSSSFGSGTRTSTGTASLPANNAWSLGEVWYSSPPTVASNEAQWETNGIYVKATDTITWEKPYLSYFKVGALSAITANLGTITAGSITSVTVDASTITGGLFRTATTGQRIVLNESASNTIRCYANGGAGTELLFEVGTPTVAGWGTTVGKFGSDSVGNSASGVVGQSRTGYGVLGLSRGSGAAGVYGENDGVGPGVVGAGLGVGVHGIALSGGSGVAFKGDGGVSIAKGTATHDPYGTVAVTRDTGASYCYYGLTRAATHVMGIGIDTSNQLWIGSPTSGHDAVLSTRHFTTGYAGTKAEGAFGCNTKSPQGSYPVNGASSDLATVIALCNQLRAALVANGVCA